MQFAPAGYNNYDNNLLPCLNTQGTPREAGGRPRSRSFCCEKLYFGARPGGLRFGARPRGLRFGARPIGGGLFGDGEDEGGDGHEHRGHGEEDARGGAEEGVAGLRLLGLYVDHIILL